MTSLRDVLKREFNVDESRLSPQLRECLDRLEKLENDADECGRYMEAPLDKQREAWRIIDGQ